jgi:hypothetical protein
VRKQIREAVVTELKKITAFSNRVYPYRTTPHLTLPDVVVFIPEEKIIQEMSTFGANGMIQMRAVTILVAIRAKATADIDDALDGYCVSVEEHMVIDDTFGGIMTGLTFEGTTVEFSGELEKTIGMAILTYTGMYRTAASAPETSIP